MGSHENPEVDRLFADLLAAGEAVPRIAAAFGAHPLDEDLLIALLHRALPVAALEYLARTPPWSERSRVLAGIVLNPKAPPRLASPLVPYLLWRSLADVAATPRLPSAVRFRAEATLKEQLPHLRLGERISLGRIATPAVLVALLADPDERVLTGCLQNPRLRESDLVQCLRRTEATPALMTAVGGSRRWRESYAVRLELVLQPRCPLGIALAQISSLVPRDLRRVAQTEGLVPLVRVAAERVASGSSKRGENEKNS
jgi:hypothetical protein